MEALNSLRLRAARPLVTSDRNTPPSSLAPRADPGRAAFRCGLAGCSRALTAATATRSAAAMPTARGRLRISRATRASRTAAKRRTLATPTRANPVSRCGLLAGVPLGRRAPSGESLGSLDAGFARRSTRVARAATIECGSSSRRASSRLDHLFRSPPGASTPARTCHPLRVGGRAAGGGLLCALRRYCCRFRPATPFEYLAKIPLGCVNWTQFGRI